MTWTANSSAVNFMVPVQLDPNVPTITSYYYTVAPTTGATVTLVKTLSFEAAPTLSPSGSFVALLGISGGVGPVDLMNADGSGLVTVANATDYRWTSGNQLVMYDSHDNTLVLAAPAANAAATTVVQLPSAIFYSGFDAR